MKRRSTHILLATMLTLMLCVTFTNCKDDNDDVLIGNWVQIRDMFPLAERGGAVCFQIGETAYIGTGVNTYRTDVGDYFRNFASVTPDGNGGITWSSNWEGKGNEGISSMPDAAMARYGAVGFALNGKGYVGLGYTGEDCLRDFWEFDPAETPSADQYTSTMEQMRNDEARANVGTAATGRWSRIADFPGKECRHAVAFVVHSNTTGKDYAYVGTGEDGILNLDSTFYRFDGEKWEEAPACSASRSKATSFVMNIDGIDYAYLYGGVGRDDVLCRLERFNADTETWEDCSMGKDSANIALAGATSFVLPDRQKAYVTTGGAGYAGNSTWEYDPLENSWTQKTFFEGPVRCYANSFVFQQPDNETGELKYVPYLTLGGSSSYIKKNWGGWFYDDVWYFEPSQDYDEHD